MKIRAQFTLLFALMVGIIIFFFSFSIYYLSENFRKNDFHSRLEDKAIMKLKLLVATGTNQDNLSINKPDASRLHSLVDCNIVIYDENDKLLYRDTAVSIPAKKTLNSIKTNTVYTYSDSDIEYFGFVYSYQGNTYTLISSAHDQYGTKYIKNLKGILIVRGSIIMVIIFISGWLYAGRFLKPITKIVNQVNNITDSNLNHRLSAENKNDEIGHLTNTFNRMLERLEISFNSQKRFVTNASHELRNPLTAISGQVDVALLKDREIEEYKTILRSISIGVKNLGILSNNLLELANSDVETVFQNFEDIRIDEILWNLRDEIIRQKTEYAIHIHFENIAENESFLTCKGEERLLKTAFANIIDNACKFSQNKTVEIKVVFDKKNTSLFFKDAGIGIPEKHFTHLFEPFSRGRNTNGIPGNGIGLSLTKRIINIHAGKIFIRSIENEGTTVRVTLPNLS